MYEKRHCCCCVPLHEGVALVGVYGTAFHTALLVVQTTFGPTIMPQPELLHPEAADILEPLILLAHSLGIFVNLLLVIGVWRNKRSLLIPWLLVQGILAALLSAMALYFLVLFPEQTDCFTEKPSTESEEKYFHPLFELYEDRTQAPFNPAQGQCTILLWYSVVMVLSLLVLVYYVYVVQDYFAQKRREAKERRKDKFPPPIPIIEFRERQIPHGLDEAVFVQELEDVSPNETHQTNVTDFGEEVAAGLQIKPLATSSSKRPTRDRPTVTFGDTEIM